MGALKWFYKKMVRSNTRGMCRVLLYGFNIAREEEKKGRFVSKHYSDYIIFAMQGRTGWTQIDDCKFKHNKTYIEIIISADDSLIKVAKEVARVETFHDLYASSGDERCELLQESKKAVEEYFKKKWGELE